MRSEISYAFDREISQRYVLPLPFPFFDTDEQVGSSDDIAWVVGVDWFGLSDTLLSVQAFQNWIVDHDDEMLRRKIETAMTFFARRRFLDERLSVHEGAAQYYDREKPSFWNEQADFMRTVISLLAVFASMSFAARNWFQGAQKNRADAYNKDLIELLETAEGGEYSAEYYRSELGRILTQVIDDLDNDRISRDGFDEFSFTWQAVSQLLGDSFKAEAK